MTKEVPRTSVLRDEELIAYLRLQGLDKDIASADRIEALLEQLFVAGAYIADLESHEGAEGFSESTAALRAIYYAIQDRYEETPHD